MATTNQPPTNYNAVANASAQSNNANTQQSIKDFVKVEKPTLKKKVLGFLFSDRIDSIGSYLLTSVAGPALKTLVFNMITGATQMALFGNSTVQNVNGSNLIPGLGLQNRPNIFNYSALSQQPTFVQSPIMAQPAMTTGYAITNEVSFTTKDVANTVLDRMKNLLMLYGKVKIGDFYRSAEVSPPANNWTLESNGWYDLSGAQPIMTTDGRWILSLPPVRQL